MSKKSIWKKLKAYRLQTQVWITVIMFCIFVLSLVLYQLPELRSNAVVSSILVALFTSLLVTVFTMIADIVVSYQSHKNEQFLENLSEFGIKNLYRDKKVALQTLLSDCDRMIWISGYRLILTCNLKKDIYESIRRGADVKAVICPPWEEAFKMVYGDNEKVLDNYLQVFDVINKGRKEMNKRPEQMQIVFVDKPIFSDTYRVDQNLITGPYMHNRDEEYHRLMAKDFFSYNIVRQSSLYKIVDDEYKTLFGEAKYRLNWDKFEKVYQEIEASDYREAEKMAKLRDACEEIPADEKLEA